jgi:hypothetical protein
MGVANVLACGHVGGRLDTLVEGLEPLIALAAPQLGEAYLDGMRGVFVSLVEASLKLRNAEDRLEGGIDPTGSANVTKSEHATFGRLRSQ